jgi:hypothetical protein
MKAVLRTLAAVFAGLLVLFKIANLLVIPTAVFAGSRLSMRHKNTGTGDPN